MNVLVRKNNQERGPYTEAELRDRLKSGVFSGSDLGWVESDGDWKPLSEILLASVLAGEKAVEAPPPKATAQGTSYLWLRDPKVIGGAVALLLLIFGGINWLNKASEKRREDAVAARQAAAMQQAQKQAEEYSRQEQERAAKARQAQLDQVKQMMAMTDKAQRDYQEKQKREQEERQKADQAKIDAEQRKQEEANKEAEKRRLAAEAKQKAQEAELLKNQPKPAATVALKPNAPAGSAPTITLAAMPVGPLSKEREKIVFSDDLARVFVIAAQGSRVQAIVDGVPGPLCRKLTWPWQRASVAVASYGSSLGQWPNNIPVPGPPPFSPDKKRVAYIIGLDQDKEAVVIDGIQSPAYDKVEWLGFAPIGHRVAYQGMQLDRPGAGPPHRSKQAHQVIDEGRAGPVFDEISGLTFSADGQHLVYVAHRQPFTGTSYGSPNFGDHRACLVIDRQPQSEFENIDQLQVSRDGKHTAYVARQRVQSRNDKKVVSDGKEGPSFATIEKLTLSENGSRCAYVARGYQNDQPSAVVDNGVKGPDFGFIAEIAVGADGRRLGYIASLNWSGDNRVVVDNGKRSVPYDRCEKLKVSADGSLLSFFAGSSQGTIVVVNGQEFGPFYQADNNLTYSADGKHWACSVQPASDQPGQFLADGEIHPIPKAAAYSGTFSFEYRPERGGWYAKGLNCELEINNATPDMKVPMEVVYSRDGQHLAKNFPNNQEATHSSEQVFLDDKPVGGPFHRIRDLQVSDDGRHIAFSTSTGDPRGSGDLVVYDREEGPKHSGVHDLIMTPDGRHIAYSVEDRNEDNAQWHVVVDGFAGPDFDYDTNYHLASSKFNPDGSLTFVASLKRQLARYTYSADALKFMPTIGQTENVTAGFRVLQNLGNFADVARDLVLGPNETLYGVASRGGEHGNGALFSCKTDGSDFKMLHSFYGAKESGAASSLAGHQEKIWGTAGFTVFCYDTTKAEYRVVTSEHGVSGVRGILPDGSLLGEEGFGDRHWWMLSQDGSSLEKTDSQNPWHRIAGIGPDGAIYWTTSDSLCRQASFWSEPKLLHKFLDSPEEGADVAPLVTFDPAGTVYGFCKGRTASIIYRIRPDGSDFRVLVPQSQGLKVSTLACGDDGMLYGCFTAELKTADSQNAGFFSVPADGGKPTILPNVRTGTDHALLYKNRVIYYTTDSSIARVQLPSATGAAKLTPVVTIKNVAPQPLALAEPVSFTSSSGDTVPRAKAPVTQKALETQPGAAMSAPADAGSSTAIVSNQPVSSPQNPPPTHNPVAPVSSGKSPTANFENEPASGDGLSQQQATTFAMTNINAMSSGDIDTLASFYGNQVDYQDKGVISNDAVRNEFQQYFARWPQTTWQLAGAVAVQPAVAGRCQITFPVSFDATNPAANKHATGVARQTLILEQDASGAWKIVSERQTTTSSKSDTGHHKIEPEKVYHGKPVDRRPPVIPIAPNIPWPPPLPRP